MAAALLKLEMMPSLRSTPTVLFNLGQMYQHGSGVVADTRKAFTYYQRAADAGDHRAHVQLGGAYYFGIGVTQNRQKAVEHFTLVADKNEEACFQLGVCYFFGEGVSRNVAKAKQLLEQAAAGNSVEIKAQAEELLAQIPN
jgi:hypothetical protein